MPPIQPAKIQKPVANLAPSNGPAPAPKSGNALDRLAALLAIKPVALVALLDDDAALQAVADALNEYQGVTPEEGNAVEAQLARTLKGPRLAKALALQRATVAARASKARR